MQNKKSPDKKAAKPAPVQSKKTEDPQVKDSEATTAPDLEAPAVKASKVKPKPAEATTAPDLEAPAVKASKVKPKPAEADAKKDYTPLMLKRAKEVFASHAVDILYFTEDNTAFLQSQFARIHAESLNSQKVTPIERKEIE